MDIEPAKRTNGLEILAYQDLLLGFREPSNFTFTLNELKVEFHRRVKNRLYQHCLRYCKKNRMDESTTKDIFQETILKGFDKIGSFRFENTWGEEKLKNMVCAWLNTIASNQIIDLLKEKSKIITIDEDYDEIEEDGAAPDDFEFEQEEITELQLQVALDSLNERERLIINICIKHDCLDNKNHLPDDVLADLCLSLKMKKGNIRTTKLRALKKMRIILKKN